MRKFFQFLVLGICLLSYTACDTNNIFDEYKPVPDESWHKDSLMVFTVPISDTLQNHNININIRNNINYAYSNLWLFTLIQFPEGTTRRDTFEMVLANPSGEWLGEGFSGYKTRKAIYRSNVYFPHSGEYKISIQQGMRQTELKGISDVGIQIEKTD